MVTKAFESGFKMMMRMMQMQREQEAQRMRGEYMGTMMRAKEFEMQQAREKQLRLDEFMEKTQPTTEVAPGALESYDPFLTPGIPGGMVEETPSPIMEDPRMLARELMKLEQFGAAAGLMGQDPELEWYKAQTGRMKARKGKGPKEATPPGKFTETVTGGKKQDWIADAKTTAGKYPGYRKAGVPYIPSTEKAKPPAPPTLPQQQRATVVEINEIIDRYGGKIDFIALAQMDKQQRSAYLKQQQMDLLKRVKEPQRTRLRRLYKKLEKLTENIVGKLPDVEEEKIATEEIINKYLQTANPKGPPYSGEDRERARVLATEDGYRW